MNYKGVGELLKSRELQEYEREIAESLRAKCGPGYETDVKIMPTRAIASVYTDTKEAMVDNANNNTLLRAIG